MMPFDLVVTCIALFSWFLGPVSAAPDQPLALASETKIFDQAGRRQGTIHITPAPLPAIPIWQTGDPSSPSPAGINIYRSDGTRAGYGVQRSDGSVDLFRPDGSRLGVIQPGIAGQPSRIIIQPSRRK
jgi:hypothetical protein